MLHAIAIGDADLEVTQSDLLTQDVDAIVNPANEHLMHGGGLAGIIQREAGAEFERESQEHALIPTGSAGITTAGNLPQEAVIHAVGPVWRGGESGEPELLARAHASALEVAEAHGFKWIAFPAVSCGVFGYPVELAAPVAVSTVAEVLKRGDTGLRLVRFCLRSDEHFRAFSAALEEVRA